MKYFFFIVALLLTISCGNGGLPLSPSTANSATLAVGVAETYTTITAAVAAASNNDTITIENGTYHEVINTALLGLTFTGESRAGVIWTGMDVATGSPSWSKTGGYTNIYEATATDIAANPVDDRGIVDDNRTGNYKLQADLATTDAIPGSFFLSGGTIYVHTSDGASPATHTMWYESDEAWEDILTVDGGTTVQNITFVGATQFGIRILDSVADIGTITIDNCEFRALYAGIWAVVTGGTAGTLNVTNSNFLYVVNPTYDPNYSIFTNALGATHPYEGLGVYGEYLDTVNVEDNVFRFLREGTNDTGSTNFNIRRNIVTDISVHPHMHNLVNGATLRMENGIYSMWGSTNGPRSGNAATAAGFTMYVINNTVYPGENTVNGIADRQWLTGSDSSAVKVPTAIYVYNNVFLKDKDGNSNNAQPFEFNNIALDTINMDNNVYGYTSVEGGTNENFVRFQTTNYTIAEWIAYTDGQADPKSVSAVYETVPADLYLSVLDFSDTENVNFGKILAGSPMIDAATATHAPATDFAGVSRPQGVGDDIGAYEYVAPPTYAPFLP